MPTSTQCTGPFVGVQAKAQGRCHAVTTRGALAWLTRNCFRIWCATCLEMRDVESIVSMDDQTKRVSYVVILKDCGHQRDLTVQRGGLK